MQRILSIGMPYEMKRVMRRVLIILLSITLCTSSYAQFEEVNGLIRSARYAEAIDKLEEFAQSAKKVELQSWCYYQIGEIHYTYLQQYTKAVDAYDKIRKLEKKGLPSAELFLASIKKGDVYCRMGKYAEAIQTYHTLVELAPSTHFVHKTGLQKIRDIRTALTALEVQQAHVRKYKGTPIAAIAQFQIAELYRNQTQLNRPEEAIIAYKALLEAHPNAPVAPEAQWRIAHLRHTVLNQLTAAIDAYQKVVDTYPASNFAAEALFQMATVYRTTLSADSVLQREQIDTTRLNDSIQKAITVFEEIKQKYPNFWNMPAVLYWTGICQERNGNYPKAVEAFKTFLHVYLPHLEPGYLGQISMYDKSLSGVKALIYAKIEKLERELSQVEFERLQWAVSHKNFAEALIIARNLISTAPRTEQAKQAAAQLRSIAEQAAIQNLSAKIQAGALTPTEKARALLQIGTIYERQLTDYSNAIQAYQKVVEFVENITVGTREPEISPVSVYAAEALYRTGIVYAERLSNPNKALGAYKKIIEQHPNASQAMMANFQLGELYRKLHRYKDALQAYQTTIGYPERARYLAAGYQDSFADRAQFRIGRVHYEDRRYTEASFAFEEFIRLRPHSPRLAAAYVYLAVINQELEETARAIERYKNAEVLLTDTADKGAVQMGILIDEAGMLGLQGSNANAVRHFLQAQQKRLNATGN